MVDDLHSRLDASTSSAQLHVRDSADSAPDVKSPLARRQRLLLWTSCATAVVSTIGLIASIWVKSPGDVAASAKPPRPTVMTAPVNFKKMQRTTIFRGEFTPYRLIDFVPRSAAGISGDGNDQNRELLVTKTPLRIGDGVRGGALIVEVSYRPVIALPGRIPAIRDLAQGDSGPDVRELQRGLAQVGHGQDGDRAGEFGSGTARAVRGLYSALGYKTATADVGVTAKDGPRGARKPVRLMVPKSEVMYIPSFPARISALAGRVGSEVTGRLLTVTIGGSKLTGQMEPSVADSVKVGQHVSVLVEESGRTFSARVERIGKLVSKPPADQQAAPYIPVSIRSDRPWSASFQGQGARITVTSAATAGRVLVVPISAITAPADGQASVTVMTSPGKYRRVTVLAGMSADGFVEVRPLDNNLQAGDAVVVGR